MITDEELLRIQQRADQAQVGPWKAYIEGRDHESGSDFIMTGAGETRGDDIEMCGASVADYDFIANSRQDISRLISEIHELKNKWAKNIPVSEAAGFVSHIKIVEESFGNFTISTDKSKLDILAIHDFLSKYSGWSDNIPFERVKESIEHSLNFGLFDGDKQIGFARVISDYSTIAYLGDIYILDDYRRQGLSRKLMEAIIGHPNLQGLRRWILLTSTADWLYEKYGFTKLPQPELYMERYNPDVYK